MSVSVNRDERLEYLRVFSCFMVILGHISNWYMREYPDLSTGSYLLSVLLNAVCRVSVPLFFMISGALLLEQQTDYKKSGTRAVNMFIKTVVWTIVYIVWDFFYLGEKYELREMFSTPVRTHFWFMFVMVGIYITLPFWQKLISGDSRLLLKYFSFLFIGVLAVSFILRINDMTATYEIPIVGSTYYVGYFIMGYAIRHYIDDIKIKKHISLIVILGCTLATVLFTTFFSLKFGVHIERFSEFRSVFVGLAAMSVFYLVMKIKSLKHYKWIAVVSKYSFDIYMTHVFFLDILQENLDVTKISAWIGIPVFFVVLLVSSFAFSWIYGKAKGNCKFV